MVSPLDGPVPPPVEAELDRLVAAEVLPALGGPVALQPSGVPPAPGVSVQPTRSTWFVRVSRSAWNQRRHPARWNHQARSMPATFVRP